MRDIFLHLEELKKERNAIILAHYYQAPEIPDDIRIRALKPLERMLVLS